MRVLVVENDLDVAALLHDSLLELGHQPVVVRSAAAALARLDSDRPDAILLDLLGPGLSGLDFLRLTPVRESAVPIVAMSGHATESQARECLRLGAVDFVTIPLDLKRLGEVLACVEPTALVRRMGEARAERRRMPRIRVSFPVRVSAYDGREWDAHACDLSPLGIRVAGGPAVPAGTAAMVAFGLPDGQPPLRVPSVLLRAGHEGYAFSFVSVGTEETRRLTEFTRQPT